ncbi:hypothetical protein BaRGS_00028724 [Batillaria attramentaria]|uniref:RING-type E3 ubiquitin transferase n=1 Tax=Batillaria attramentaria TaxID=370345 RepID=A0ABD0JY67_9CAEN
MAEASVESPPCSGRFYCHQCSAEITPNLPDYTCPRCNSGFIEEVAASNTSSNTSSRNSPQARGPTDPAAQFAEMWTQALLGSNFTQMDQADQAGRGRDRGQGAQADPRPGPSGSQGTVRVIRPAGRNPYVEGLINYFLTRLGGEAAVHGIPINMFQLHGNPADYAWGAGGLDTIITQLLNQLESSGPPPAEADKIDALPSVTITQEQVAMVLQCSICMEDFTLEEEAKRLPCEHHYHKDCIIRWLEMHGTCPVCRKDLNGRDTSTKDTDLLPPIDELDQTLDSRPRGSNPADPSSSNTSMDSHPSLD